MPEPNEVIHTWTDEDDLLNNIRGVLFEKTGRHAGFGPGAAPTVEYVLTLQDRFGEPLRFPLRLVSRTSFPLEGGESAKEQHRDD